MLTTPRFVGSPSPPTTTGRPRSSGRRSTSTAAMNWSRSTCSTQRVTSRRPARGRSRPRAAPARALAPARVQVDPDPVPRAAASAHRVDQDVGAARCGQTSRVARLPPVEPGLGPRPCWRPGRSRSAAWCCAGGRTAPLVLPGAAVARRGRAPAVGRAGSSAGRRRGAVRPAPAVATASRRCSSMPAAGSPSSASRRGTVSMVKLGRVAVGHLVPEQRGGDAGVRRSGARSRPRRWCGPWRSGCSRRRRRAAPPSTTGWWRGPGPAPRPPGPAPARPGAAR